MFPMINYDESTNAVAPIPPTYELPPDLDPLLIEPAQRLLARFDEVMLTLQEQPDEDMSGRPHYSNHLAEDASDASEWQSRAAVSHHLLREMRQIERAQALLQMGRYGQCEQCGHAIPPRRLLIIPSATLCVKCQESADMAAMGH